MEVVYNNAYPKFNGSTANDAAGLTLDAYTHKKCISDFNNALIQSGLIRTTISGQLDIESITQFDHRQYLSVNVGVGDIVYTYDPLIYTFNDELNATHPCYLKISFFYYCGHPLATVGVNAKNCNLILGARVGISKDEQFNIKQTIPPALTMPSASAGIHIYGNQQINQFSEVINSKNCLFVNLCPYWMPYASTFPHPNQPVTSMLNFLLYRSVDGDFILYKSDTKFTTTPSYDLSLDSISTVTELNINAYHITNFGTTFIDKISPFDTYVQKNVFNSSMNVYLAPTSYTTDKNILNYDILTINREFTSKRNKKQYININLPDGSKAKYKVIGYPAYPVRFYSDDIAILIRVD